jgi:hypothetical protein
MRYQSTQDGGPAASLAGEDGLQGLNLLLVGPLVKIEADRPATLKSIAGHTNVPHYVQAI